MKFTAREDLALPADKVFQGITDFEAFERSAMRRGADVVRVSGPNVGGVGCTWESEFTYRGRRRTLRAEVTTCDPDDGVQVASQTSGITGNLLAEVVELAPTRSRLLVRLELEPTSLSARLLVQSLKLAKTNLDGRFSKRVADFARTLEERHGVKRMA